MVRRAAASALGRIGRAADAGVPALIAALRDPAPCVRRAAVLSLANVADPAAVPALRTALLDETEDVRREAT